MSTPEFIKAIVSGDYNENDVIQRCKNEPSLTALFKSLLQAASTMAATKGMQGGFMWSLSGRRFDFDNPKDMRLYTDVEFARLQSTMAIVCDHIERQDKAEQRNTLSLTEEQQTAFQKAIEAKLMEQTESGYKWLYGGNRGGGARLAYFIHKVFNPNGCSTIPYKALEALFDVIRLDSAIQRIAHYQANDQYRSNKVRKWIAAIDDILK